MATDCLGRDRNFVSVPCAWCGKPIDGDGPGRRATGGNRAETLCQVHRREQTARDRREAVARRGARQQEENRTWKVVRDPCDAPMAKGAKLSERMVAHMLQYACCVVGMKLENNRRHWVVTRRMTLRWRNVEMYSMGNGELRRVEAHG